MEWHYVEYLFISVSTFNLLLKAKYPVFHTNKKKYQLTTANCIEL